MVKTLNQLTHINVMYFKFYSQFNQSAPTKRCILNSTHSLIFG